MTAKTLFLCAVLCAFAAGAAALLDLRVRGTLDDPDGRRPDRPGDQDRYFYEQRLYPTGTIPARWYERAVAHMDLMRAAIRKSAATWNWVSLGPTNIGGRMRAMAADPTDARILYAGAAGGGVWKTTNGGVTWRPLTDFLPNLRIGAIAVDPRDRNAILAGCGEGFVVWQDGLAYGRGIYGSTDAGETWILVPSTDNANFEYVFDIAYDPADPSIVLAATGRGVMRSTDGGAQWTRVLAGARGVRAVFSPAADGTVWAGLEGSGIHRSTDHGATWSTPLDVPISAGTFTRVQIAVAPSDPQVLYASFTAHNESCAGVFRSTDGGDSWRKINTPLNEIDGDTYMRQQGEYNSVLAVHPADPDLVWAGGIDLYRSTNGGVSWKQMTNWYPQAGYTYVHADQHAFVFDPVDPRNIAVGCDGGCFRSSDGGTSFTSSNNGFVTAQFHSGAPHPTSDLVLGGTIDNGTLRVNSGTIWSDVTGGDGGYAAIDVDNPRTMFAEIYYLTFLKSTDFGINFVSAMNGIPHNADGSASERSAFIAPFEMDPSNARTLYAGTVRLYRTTNSAGVWTAISGDIGGGGYITAIGVAPSNGAVLYVGSSTGRVNVTTNAGTAWRVATNGLPNRYVTDIAVDRTNANVAYLTTSGFGTGHLWKTTDAGVSWTNVSGAAPLSLPDVPANTVTINPVRPDRLYVGTDVGAFLSNDGGASWEVIHDGMGNVTVADLRFRGDGTLFAATHGRGEFKSSYSLLDSGPVSPPTAYVVGQSYPNPVTAVDRDAVTVPYALPARCAVALELYDAAGRLLRAEDFGVVSAGEYRRPISIASLPSGTYLYRLVVNGAASDAHRFAVIR